MYIAYFVSFWTQDHSLLLALICFHSLYHPLSFLVICYHSFYHSLSLVVSLVVTRCVTRCYSLSLVVPFVIRFTTRCHSLSFLVICCYSFYHSLSFDVPPLCLFINDRFSVQFSFLHVKTGNISKAHNLIEHYNRLVVGMIIFAPVRKSLRNGKKTFPCPKKLLRNYALNWDNTFRKIKPDWNPISVEKQVIAALYYLPDEGRMQKINFLRKFRKLSRVFCFYFRKLYLHVYLR